MTRLLEITYTTSSIGCPSDQRDTVRSLGLRRLNQTVRRPDNPSVRGMVASIQHLVTCTVLEEEVRHETS